MVVIFIFLLVLPSIPGIFLHFLNFQKQDILDKAMIYVRIMTWRLQVLPPIEQFQQEKPRKKIYLIYTNFRIAIET